MFDFDVVVYHSPCPDGETSLWSALKYKNIENIVPCCAGKTGLLSYDIYKNKKVLFVDLCPDIKSIENISNKSESIVILDHHKSALTMYNEKYSANIEKYVNETHDNVTYLLDMDRAGCQITLDYFFQDIERPWFLNYVADRDLWQWKLENSREINEGLFDENLLTVEKMTELEKYNENDIEKIKKHGEIILKMKNKNINIACKTAIETTATFNDITYNVWLVNCSNYIKSEVGNILTKKMLYSDENKLPDFTAIWTYNFPTNEWWISLRGNNKHDLSVIAKSYNEKGGGHPNASGFTLLNNDTLHDIFKITKIIE
jgi:uncharacterized protein